MKQNEEINRLGKGCGRESVREAGKVKIFQTIRLPDVLPTGLCIGTRGPKAGSSSTPLVLGLCSRVTGAA